MRIAPGWWSMTSSTAGAEGAVRSPGLTLPRNCAQAVAVIAIAAIGLAIWTLPSAAPRDARVKVRTATPVAGSLGSAERCRRFQGLPKDFGQDPHAGMVAVPGGRFEPGSLNGYPDERPAGGVTVAPFWIDRTEVTNAQFETFVKATGHVTQAELEGAAVVFQAPLRGRSVPDNAWWVYTKGANWRHPEGPTSDLKGRMNQPVVHVALIDAQAYARWLGRELPTEAQWEWAAHGGGDAERLEREPRGSDGRPQANYWQGIFPDMNTREDGFADRAPVGCFAANGYGLHDMIGNVWEWTRDVYRGARQPHGNGTPSQAIPGTETTGLAVVIKGGSFLCAADYCVRYRVAARHPQEADLGVAHVGFRTVIVIR